MHQNLVDHDLEEQWRNERKKLDEQRSKQDISKRPPVSPKRGEEPLKAELLRINPDAGSASNENDFGTPFRRKLGIGLHAGCPR